jgi:ABC-type antimicrobial peptide transport system permease subunit
MEYIGTQCGDYYLIPRRLTALIERNILDSTVDEVSEALSMHVAPLTIQIVMVPVGVTVMLGLHNPPRSWTGMVGPSLPGFTIAPCMDSLLCYRIVQTT